MKDDSIALQNCFVFKNITTSFVELFCLFVNKIVDVFENIKLIVENLMVNCGLENKKSCQFDKNSLK